MATKRNRELVLGIDFGSTRSSAGALPSGEMKMVVEQGEMAIPTALYIPQRGDPLAGLEARRRLATDPGGGVHSIKAILGAPFEDPAVERHAERSIHRLRRGPDGRVIVRVRDTDYACEQLAATVLRHLRDLAEARFDRRVEKIVASVPGDSSPGYLDALRIASRLAHLEIVEAVPEPVAGALGLGLHEARRAEPRRILICDFGGAGFTATLAHQKGPSIKAAACRRARVGGQDFDRALAAAVAEVIDRRSGFDIGRDEVRRQRLLHRCESVKESLSSHQRVRFTLRDAYLHRGLGHDIDDVIERAWIEPRWAPLVGRATAAIERLLEEAGCRAADIEQIALLGGTSQLPLFRRAVAGMFPGAPVASGSNPGISVTLGLTLRAAVHSGHRMRTPAIGHAA